MNASPTGTVFDIKEFAIHDGPGIRTTVFLQGCPLRCAWCHNPEGFSAEPQVLRSAGGTRLSGRIWTAADLAEHLLAQADVLRDTGGGVTFSGGEPLMQASFVVAVIECLEGLHVALDTCGHASADTFRRVVNRVNLVLFDMKLADTDLHRTYTGVDNLRILKNLGLLKASGTSCVIRVPLVPGITDTAGNLEAIAALVADFDSLLRVELLPYNRVAGAKYDACGRRFSPTWDEQAAVRADTRPFAGLGVPVKIRR